MAMTREQEIELEKRLIERGAKDFAALSDAFEVAKNTEDRENIFDIRKLARQHVDKIGSKAVELYHKTLIYAAGFDFDSFMLALEFNRPPKEQFWLPRRSKLMPVCKALQDMIDGKLDELFLSMPPRVGKTGIIQMFLVHAMMKNPEASNLYCSFSAKPVKTFYNGLLEILKDPNTYLLGDVAPGRTIVGTNAEDNTIDIDRRKKYSSFTGRSIDGSLNGSCDCNGFLVGDDLCEGIEEALSPVRMRTLWTTVDNNMIPRAKEGAKRIWMGTRWNTLDPQGVRLDLLRNDPNYSSVRWKYINTPALNEDDESNFDYAYGVGFSTEFYKQRRASFERNSDMPSWFAQYQGEPVNRGGAVFNPDYMRYFNGVMPDADPDRVFMAVDPAWGGGDYVAAPVCVQFGDDIYIPSVVYDNGDKMITQPLIVEAVKKYGIQAVYVEATKTTASYTQELDKRLRDIGIRVNLQSTISHYTGNGKRQRIFDKAPEIKERMIFLEDGKRDKPYSMFMQNVYAFTVEGTLKHEDAPDSLGIAMAMAFMSSTKVEVMRRPW